MSSAERLPPKRVSIDLRFLADKGMGSATYQRALWHGLRQVAAPDIEFVCHGWPPQADDDPRWHYRPGPTPPVLWWNWVTLPRRLWREAPLLHHATMNFHAPLDPPCPLVLTLLDLIPLMEPQFVSRRYSWLFGKLIRPLLRRADRVIVPTETVAEDAIALDAGLASKLRIVPCGLLPNESPRVPVDTAAEVRRRFGIPDDYLLFIGPPEPRKNLDVLLEAQLRLRDQRRPALPLVTVGATHFRDAKLAALRGRCGTSHIDCGAVSAADLAVIRRGARALLFPSHCEGFGYPPLEALEEGVPVVASRIPVLREVLGDHAVFLQRDDVGEWAEVIEAITEDGGALRPLAERGRAWVRRYSAKRLAEGTVSIYREVFS